MYSYVCRCAKTECMRAVSSSSRATTLCGASTLWLHAAGARSVTFVIVLFICAYSEFVTCAHGYVTSGFAFVGCVYHVSILRWNSQAGVLKHVNLTALDKAFGRCSFFGGLANCIIIFLASPTTKPTGNTTASMHM